MDNNMTFLNACRNGQKSIVQKMCIRDSKYSPYDAYLPPNIDDFIFVWLASQILVIYLFLAIGISYLLKRKELLTKQDNGKAVPC